MSIQQNMCTQGHRQTHAWRRETSRPFPLPGLIQHSGYWPPVPLPRFCHIPRLLNMVRQMDQEGFGNCTVTGSCEAVCPKEISLNFIAKMNRDYGAAIVKGR